MVRFIVHPGYAKTATTFLQRKIFSQLKDVLYLGMFPDSSMLSNGLTTMFGTIFPRFTDIGTNEIRARNSSLLIPTLGNLILREMDKHQKAFVLLSNERLFDYGHYNGELNQFLLSKLIRYLKDNCDEKLEIKVIVTIRNQKDILESYYAFFYSRLKNRFPSFQDFLRFGLENKHEIVFGSYHYDSILKDIEDIYGSNNIQVFLHERMQLDVKASLHDMMNFIGTKEKVEGLDYGAKVNVNSEAGAHHLLDVEYGSAAKLLMKLRKMYSYTPSKLRHLERIRGFDWLRATVRSHSGSKNIVSKGVLREFPKEFVDAINDMYRDSNNNLSKMLNTDLEQYGYIGGKKGDPLKWPTL